MTRHPDRSMTGLFATLFLCSAVAGATPDRSDPDHLLSKGVPEVIHEDGFETLIGLDARPENATCALPDRPAASSGVGAERVFERVGFTNTVSLVRAPHDSRWYAVDKAGFIAAFDGTDPDKVPLSLVLNIGDRVYPDTGETGLLGLAFHPDFPATNEAYVIYTDLVDDEHVSYLSAFSSNDGGVTLDPSSERNLITLTGHRNQNHKGGTLMFGPDGYLYAGLGDGGNKWEAQDPENLFGTIIRIDVDGGVPYGIPPDNPFADGEGGAPEVFAYGLRNPWRWSFDSLTGDLWVTDVGLQSWEEVNLVEAGGNYGWPVFEGDECQLNAGCDGRTGLIPPLHAYPHNPEGGFVVVGGFVYRGADIPALEGRFVFADGLNKVWSLAVLDGGGVDVRPLLAGGLSGPIIRSMFEDETGELYLVKADRIFQLVEAMDGELEPFPQLLSETGCFLAEDPTEPAPALIPYDVNSRFWTDGAGKSRWMALPDGGTVALSDDGDFLFPIGTVLAKEFRVEDTRVETRLFARHDDGQWAGYSYRWNESQTDATLVGATGVELDIDGTNYTIPGRAECVACHTGAANDSLGPEVLQLNRHMVYPSTGRRANQLETLEAIGVLAEPLPAPVTALPALARIDDETESLELRSRSYLHSNCSSCHRPDGGGRGPADLRFQDLGAMNICDVLPETDDFDIEDARLLAPGAPERSILSVRLALLGAGAMPPIGKNKVDIHASAVLAEFIAGLESCEAEPAAR